MRRWKLFVLLLAVLVLSACGKESESVSAASLTEVTAETEIIHREAGLAVETSEYVLEGVDGGISGPVYRDGGLEFLLTREETASYCIYDLTEQSLSEIPLGTWDGDHYIARIIKDDAGFWTQRADYTWSDRSAGEADCRNSFHRLDLAGNELCSVELEQNWYVSQMTGDNAGGLWAVAYSMESGEQARLLHLNESGEITEEATEIDLDSAWGLYTAEDGTLLILTDMRLYFWKDGTVLGEESVEFGKILSDGAGNLYCANLGVGDALYALDLGNYKLGEKLTDLYGALDIWYSGGTYDFLLSTNERVLGLNLGGSVSELYALTEAGGRLALFLMELGENQYLSLEYSGLLRENVLKKIEVLDEALLPEKQTIVLATTEEISLYLYMADLVEQYNSSIDTWQIEVDEYPDKESLAMALATGEKIDIVICGGSGNNNVFYQDLMEQGLLRNLYDCMESQGEMTREDLVPCYRRVAEEDDGGLYRLSSRFRVILVLGNRQYAGDDGAMTIDALMEAAKSMPEGMDLMQAGQLEMLEMLTPLEQLVDWDNKTCNFECQTFYDILSLIRDYVPAAYEYSEASEEPLLAGEVLLQYVFGLSVEDSAELLARYPEEDFSVVGEPGRGIKIMLDDGYGITTSCENPEAAWDFLATLLEASVQERNWMGLPVVQTVLDSQKEATIANGTVTEEELARFMDVLEGDIYIRRMDSAMLEIIREEAQACFQGDKSPEETAKIIQSRVMIYLSE